MDDEDGRTPPAVLALRPIANPLTAGLAGLAIATFVMSGLELHWYGGERLQAGLVMAIAGPLLQTIAALVAVQARDSNAATAMGLQAATWLYSGVLVATTPKGSHSAVLGTALFVSAAAMFLSASNSARVKPLFAAVAVTTALRWALSGIAETTAISAWGHASAIVGIVLAALALFTATRGQVRETTAKQGRAQPEPGVRETL